MKELSDQLFLQMVVDTIRVVMVLYGLAILYVAYAGVNALLKLIGKLTVKGCKAIWRFVRNVIKRPEVAVTTEQNTEV